jgi:seryl-tRNA synthetase
MLDIKFIRQNPDKVKQACKNKQVKVDIDKLLEADKKRREVIQALEDMRTQKNKASKIISFTRDMKEKKKMILEMQELDKNSDRLNKNLKKSEEEFNNLMLQVPNLPQEDVPVGEDEKDNVVIKEVGKKPKFDFEPKDYLEISEKLDLIDIKRAAKVSGTRFGYLKNETVLIEFALVNLALNNLIKEKFIPVIPPVMLKEEMAHGTGYFEASDKREAYFIPEDNFYLVGTSEQSLIAMHSNEILEEKDLPKRYVGFSTCFRREAGAYGKDTKGILRVHQFDKVEMVSICRPEDSKKEHQFFLGMEENLMKFLGLPFQIVKICTGDLGRPAAAKYDIEVWIPSENKYRETHSTSNCTDFQARRLNIRYRDKAGKLNFVHTLNGTAFAIGRILIAILENYQQKDGSIKIPDILQKYTGFKEIKR